MEVDFNEYFYYDEGSKTGIRWNINPTRRPNQKDKEAGTQHGKYFIVKLNQERFLVHRVVWEMFNGPIPEGMVIDHLNGNPSDNYIENLSCKTRPQNMQNCKRNKRNKSGIVGVHFVKEGDRIIAVVAGVIHNNIKKTKYFSVKINGLQKSIALASEWREFKEKELNEQGAMYTSRHGAQ